MLLQIESIHIDVTVQRSENKASNTSFGSSGKGVASEWTSSVVLIIVSDISQKHWYRSITKCISITKILHFLW